jgi:thioredoxin-dependent peroxiredoxin
MAAIGCPANLNKIHAPAEPMAFNTVICHTIFIHHSNMTHLTEGQKAPAFSGKNQNGEKISLSQFKGKKVALYFYPEDLTPTCTDQACNLRDNFAVLAQHGITVVGVSPDDEAKHKKFEAKHHLPFSLLADVQHRIIDKYGVWGEKQMYGRKYMGLHRTTFLIDEKGTIKKIFLKPKSKQHAAEILNAFTAIGK